MVTPLVKKLRIKSGEKILFINEPAGYSKLLMPLPASVKLTSKAEGKFDSIHVFIKSKAELEKQILRVKKFLDEKGTAWICFPKKSSGIKTDIDRDSGWAAIENSGFKFISLIAINETWSAFGLRFETVIPVYKERVVTPEELKYIDKENRLVKTPPDLSAELQKSKTAFEYFNSLSFSHKKEYVLWIIEAKREETRKARIQKMIEKLLAGLKNPSDNGK
jgi:hypothetical protein